MRRICIICMWCLTSSKLVAIWCILQHSALSFHFPSRLSGRGASSLLDEVGHSFAWKWWLRSRQKGATATFCTLHWSWRGWGLRISFIQWGLKYRRAARWIRTAELSMGRNSSLKVTQS
jgi:hypothetical protein